MRVIALQGPRRRSRVRRADHARASSTCSRTWFGIPYPYGKLDVLAIPLTVGFGAMENAGLVTFTETLDAARSAASVVAAPATRWVVGRGARARAPVVRRSRHDRVVGRHLAQRGLRELDRDARSPREFEPTLARRARRARRCGTSALGADSLVTARADPPADRDDRTTSSTSFDGITYDKGASVLACSRRYVGPTCSSSGVRDYLHARAFGNATSTDFVAAISKAAGKDLAPAFATFLDQAGAPELATTIAVRRTASRALRARAAALRPARRARPAGDEAVDRAGVRRVRPRRSARPGVHAARRRRPATLALPRSAARAGCSPNADGRGYYRVAFTRDAGRPRCATRRGRSCRRPSGAPCSPTSTALASAGQAVAAARAVVRAAAARRRRPVLDRVRHRRRARPRGRRPRRPARQVRGVAAADVRPGGDRGGPRAAQERRPRRRDRARGADPHRAARARPGARRRRASSCPSTGAISRRRCARPS